MNFVAVPYISVNEGLKVVIGLSFQISTRQEFRRFFLLIFEAGFYHNFVL